MDQQKLIAALARAAEEALRRQRTQRSSELLELYASGRLSYLYEILVNHRFLMAVDTADYAQIEALVGQLFREIRDTDQDLNWQKDLAVGLFNTLCNLIAHQLGPVPSAPEQPDFEGYDSSESLECAFQARVFHLARQIAEYRVDNHEIRRIQKYIYKHYSEDICLQSLADVFSMNPGYLSELFKKQTGKNFRAFLVEVRIEHAIELLKRPVLSIAGIAERVATRTTRISTRCSKKSRA